MNLPVRMLDNLRLLYLETEDYGRPRLIPSGTRRTMRSPKLHRCPARSVALRAPANAAAPPRPIAKFGLLAVLVALSVLGAGCVQRNVERISSEEAASIPEPPAPQAGGQQAGAAEVSATRISGVIEVAPELAAAVPSNATLYLIVRVAGRATGAPLAVQQMPVPSFPYRFEITERDSMIAGTPLIGELSITARVDQDGDAFSTDPGDLSGQTSPVVAGDSDIVVILEERAGGDAGS